jgi:hypothetical protein
VKVEYSMPARDVPRELVYGGQVAGAVEPAGFAGGARVKQADTLAFTLHVRVYKPNGRTQETAARADAIGDEIRRYLAANWTLGDLADLKSALVTGVELDSWTDDDGAGSILTISVELTTVTT